MQIDSKIYVAGHNGMVGSAIIKALTQKGFKNIITKTKQELDLTNQAAVAIFFEKEKPEYVFLAAAKVGGIQANNIYRADFLYQNLMIQNNVIHQAYIHQVKKMLFLGSSCIYPKHAQQPLKEQYLLTGALEETNEPYAIAKIAGIKLCENYNRQYNSNFVSVMPTNLYGFNDTYHLENAHVIPSLIRKFYEAKSNNASTVSIWGSGKVYREFLHSDDLGHACVFVMQHYNGVEFINIGTGQDISIHDLALLIKKIVGFEGNITYDSSKPDGTPKKLLNVSKINALGWKHQIDLEAGLKMVYNNYKHQIGIKKV